MIKVRGIRHDRDHPYVVKLKDLPGFENLLGQADNDEQKNKFEKLSNYEIHLCACGLSKNKPFCYGHHAKTMKEESGKIYLYDKDGNVITTLNKLTDSEDGNEIDLPNEYE